jgi:hypothetical protein
MGSSNRRSNTHALPDSSWIQEVVEVEVKAVSVGHPYL